VDEQSLFSFISKCPSLSLLSLQGCFDESNNASLMVFKNNSSSLAQVIALSIAGNSGRKIGKEWLIVLQALKNMANLSILDISNSFIGNNGISTLPELLDSLPKLRTLILDGSQPDKAGVYISFMESLIRGKISTSISYPINDIKQLQEMGEIAKVFINELIVKWSNIDGGYSKLSLNQTNLINQNTLDQQTHPLISHF